MIGHEREKPLSDEPIGIVISRGAVLDAPPRLRAYVWAAVQEADSPPVRDPR